jgi:hypothetical protein
MSRNSVLSRRILSIQASLWIRTASVSPKYIDLIRIEAIPSSYHIFPLIFTQEDTRVTGKAVRWSDITAFWLWMGCGCYDPPV